MSYNYNSGPRRGFDIYDGRSCDNCCDTGYDRERCDYEPGNEGCLPLGIATVPMQIWRMTYNSEKALAAATMFAELNLPFLGGKCK